MRLSSSAFQNGKSIPTKFAYHGVVGGRNISIPLAWEDIPPQTKSFALSIIDPHPVANNWVHWFVVNIPATVTLLEEGCSGKNMPKGSKELYNTYGTPGYGGPEPPPGSGPHPYEVVVYALNVNSLDISANATLSVFRKTLNDKVIATAKIVGMYEQ